MSRVIVAKPNGFCFGVERAIKLAKGGLKRFGRVYTFGQLVHNPQVLDELASAGIRAIRSLDEVQGGALVIRAHGCPPEVFVECERKGIEVIDATCPYVRRVQQVARRLAAEGYQVVVVGEKNHPEVKAILAAAGNGARVFVPRMKISGRVGIVAQTTIGRERLKEAVANLLNFRYTEIRVFDTVCAEVVARQEAALRLAKRVDAIVVVGGKNSANTRRLAEIVRSSGKPVVHLTGAAGFNLRRWARFKKIGIVAGASTPAKAVEEIARILRDSGCDKQPSLRRSVSNE
ncbi:4-hydroxy-3-methylbut-2-enyl diphosphate reductase [candidate division WOR-3 bacterium]|nr:4-hydroxy-3-methylbut-2-enyl diphosphate reductase [candidate division WOR-3 bacterium]